MDGLGFIATFLVRKVNMEKTAKKSALAEMELHATTEQVLNCNFRVFLRDAINMLHFNCFSIFHDICRWADTYR